MVSPLPPARRWVSARGRLRAGLGALLGILLLAGCRCPRIVQGVVTVEVPSVPAVPTVPDPVDTAPTTMDEPDVLPSTVPTAGGAIAVVEPGVYRHDARFAALAQAWPGLVEEALALLDNRTGLTFSGSAAIEVVLGPLRDERIPHRAETRVVDGRRQAVVTVNAEPIVGGTVVPETAITRALAESVFEIVSLRHDPVPRWVVELAASLAADDLDHEVRRIHRELVLRGRTEVRVDADDAGAAFETGRAVHALFADREALGAARKMLRFAAEGDDPVWTLTRLLKEADAGWVGPARNALFERIRSIDRIPWQRLLDAQGALQETGRGGLESTLQPPLPAVIAAEAKVLRAEAAIAEGDWRAARALLGSITVEERRDLRDAAAVLALEIEAYARPDGDPVRARELMRRLDLDHPESEARRRLRETNPLMGSGDDPRAWLLQAREQIERRGVTDVDLPTLERVLRFLLLDHRAGAAVRLIDEMGERAEAPELEEVITLVSDAEEEPSAAAFAAGERRLEHWLAVSSDAAWRDVLDTGRAVFGAASGRVDTAPASVRPRLLRVLVMTGGPSDTIRWMAPLWRDAPRLAGPDLDRIAAWVDARVLRRVLSFVSPDVLPRSAVVRLWRDVSFAMDADWLDENPAFLRRVRAPTYAERREALTRAVRDAKLTPELTGRLALDPSPLMRAEAVRIAGDEGFLAIATSALRDEAATVQAEAVKAIATADPEGSRHLLIGVLRGAAPVSVKIAAARGLAATAPKDAEVLRELIATQSSDEPALQDGVAATLVELPKGPLAFALTAATRRALAQDPIPEPLIARYVLLFQRLSGADLRFTPGQDRAALRGLAEGMERWARKRRELVEQGLVPVVESPDR